MTDVTPTGSNPTNLAVTNPSTPPAAEEPKETLLQKIEGEFHTIEADIAHDAPQAETVATDAADVVDAVDPAAPAAVDPEVPVRSGPLTVDSTITQGNRLVTQASTTPDNPVKILSDKIKTHFDVATAAIADIRAIVTELETALNKLRVGL